MDKHNQKILLWILLIGTIAFMSYGVYIAHPIRNFNFTEIKVWIALSIIILPLSLFVHSWIRKNLVLKKDTQEKAKGEINEKKNNSIFENSYWIGDGCGNIAGCVPFEGEFGLIFLFIIVAAFAASFIGIIAGFLLIIIELIISKLMDLEPDPYSNPHWIIWILNSLAVLYATYFIALFITIKFLS